MPPSHHAIILVEDHPADRLFVRRALEHGRLINPIVELDSAEAARARITLASSLPVLCLLDINLPGGETGIDFLRWLRQQPGEISKIPTIILSGSRDDHDRAAGHELAALRYLEKPIAIETLVEAVRALGVTVITHAFSGQIEFLIAHDRS